ncbi:unnamed protein product [Musa acuminata subsp. burmannicoides]
MSPHTVEDPDPVPNRTLNPLLPEPPQALAASRDPAPRPALPLDLRGLVVAVRLFGSSVLILRSDDGGCGGERGKARRRQLYPQTLSALSLTVDITALLSRRWIL